ncbi:MAG: 50S ribosomal protein L17 [Phycisphaerae bacterium]|jgi:large subunit ribosomal protein L17
MRHGYAGKKLNRTKEHRLALRRNLAQSLIEHGEVRTTVVKARELRRFAEKIITLAVRGDLAARQRAIALLNDRAIIRKENQKDYDAMSDAKRAQTLRSRSGRRYRAPATRPGLKFTAESVIHKLFAEIGPAMRRRAEAKGKGGGYTRIIKLAERRLGDGGFTALVRLVGENDPPRPKNSAKTERRRKARARYAMYAGDVRPRHAARKVQPKSRAETAAQSAPPADGG